MPKYNRLKPQLKSTLFMIISLTISGCGGSSSDSSTDTLSGQLIDSPVQGLSYQTETQSGFTNSNGEFKYQAGETVTFMIGDIQFQALAGKPTLTVLDLAGTSNLNDTSVTNIARLLQSLDRDCDPDNGIEITEQAHLSADSLFVDFESPSFDAHVANLVANGGQSNSDCQALVSQEQATGHLQASLDSIGYGYETGSSFNAGTDGLPLFYGNWEGTASDNNGYSWTVQLNIRPERQTAVFPTLGAAGCDGVFELFEESPTGALFYRHVETLRDGCQEGGFVELKYISETELEYRYYGENLQGNQRSNIAASGTLFKTS